MDSAADARETLSMSASDTREDKLSPVDNGVVGRLLCEDKLYNKNSVKRIYGNSYQFAKAEGQAAGSTQS